MASSSQVRSSSLFSYYKPSTLHPSSSSSFMNGHIVSHLYSSSTALYGGLGSQSLNLSRSSLDSMYCGPRWYIVDLVPRFTVMC
ncbi:hypothetical protein SLA2020_284600 [Shorea laevis]